MNIDNALFEAWYLTRPAAVRANIDKYPPVAYKIKASAPYLITCPGTIVEIESWRESESGIVGVEPNNLLPTALEHIRELCHRSGLDYQVMSNARFATEIEFKWLEPL